MTARPQRTALWLLLPALAVLAAAYLVPLAAIVQIAVREPSSIGITDGPFTLGNLVQAVSDPYYWRIIWRTAVMGVSTAVLTTVLAYPLALLITFVGRRARGVLLILAIAPMLTSSVARSFGWIVILGSNGLMSSLMEALGADRPLTLIGTTSGIVVALSEIFLPYAVLGMVSGFGRISSGLVGAARTLGAGRTTAFLRVTLPLSMPGVLVSLILVFVLSISSYVTPRVLGGGRIVVLGTEIYDQATVSLNWPLAASLSIVLMALFGAFMGLSWLVRRRGGAA